ncbi:MAG: hypothetical protein FWG11_08545 [Promicromonosporaceae bacterium]|nr:hypothetical protein [Promicromonosporaceae bacterium]
MTQKTATELGLILGSRPLSFTMVKQLPHVLWNIDFQPIGRINIDRRDRVIGIRGNGDYVVVNPPTTHTVIESTLEYPASLYEFWRKLINERSSSSFELPTLCRCFEEVTYYESGGSLNTNQVRDLFFHIRGVKVIVPGSLFRLSDQCLNGFHKPSHTESDLGVMPEEYQRIAGQIAEAWQTWKELPLVLFDD